MNNKNRKGLNNKAIGDIGESIAIDYLEMQGYTLVERNWRNKKRGGGEIDIVMTKGVVVVFIEVKYRRQGRFGYAADSITKQKKMKLYDAALEYLLANGYSLNQACSFGAVLIDEDLSGRTISFVENIFV